MTFPQCKTRTSAQRKKLAEKAGTASESQPPFSAPLARAYCVLAAQLLDWRPAGSSSPDTAASRGAPQEPMADAHLNLADQPRPFGSSRPLFAAAAMSLVALAAMTNMLSIFRDVLQSHFRVTTAQFGTLLSIGTIPGAVGALLGGVLIDRWGPRKVLRASLLGCAAGMAMAYFGSQWAAILAALGVVAFFVGPMGIAALAYLVRLFPGRRRRALSIHLVVVSAAALASPKCGHHEVSVRQASRDPLITRLLGHFGSVTSRRPSSRPQIGDMRNGRASVWTGARSVGIIIGVGFRDRECRACR